MQKNYGKEIIINANTDETRVAIIEDGSLVEMYIERADDERKLGNIYVGKIDNIVKHMNSVFINIGEEVNAFSHLTEFKNQLLTEDVLTGNYQFQNFETPISTATTDKKCGDDYGKGDKVLVQVIKEQITNKGPRVTTDVTIPGRYIVLIPNDTGVKISKKIRKYQERRRLKRIVRNLIPDTFSVIVRTAAEKKDSDLFAADILRAYEIWKSIVKNYLKSETPKLLYRDQNIAETIVRDLFTEEVDKIRIDSRELYYEIKDYVQNVAENLVDRIEYYYDKEPIFDKYYRINKDFYISLSREVFMKQGGSIVIDHTEAMVAIDVNSKNYRRKKSHEHNTLAINLLACHEIARQLRLRDLGGLIVIDFIDMQNAEHRTKVYQELKKELKKDKAKTSVEPISRFGLIEMTRQRLKPSLVQTVYDSCPLCMGKGVVTSKESMALMIDRWMRNYRYTSKKDNIKLHINSDLHQFLIEEQNRILEIMIKYFIDIEVVIDNNLSSHNFCCLDPETGEDITKEYRN